jgi:glycyl-tRNA synthetase beta chain
VTRDDEESRAPAETGDRGELLFELLSEEIPARMQRRAIDDLVALLRGKLAAADIAAADIAGYVTPRRLTVIATGVPVRQPERREERRGPRVGAPQSAIDGFLRATGLAAIEQCEIRGEGRNAFYFAAIERPGRPGEAVLAELLREAVAELPWPKSMRYPASSLRWVRPLTSVVCLFDGAVVPLDLDQVPVGRVTRGHRWLGDGGIVVDSAADYTERLSAAHVVLDHRRRRELIDAELERAAKAAGLTVKSDPDLLDEVTGLVEYPVVLMGAIDDEFMNLPPEVLATAMRTHQKYFSCLNPDGTLAPRFLFVANNRAADGGKTIIAGNERVLRARLADARFFWDQDRKIRLEDRVAALKERVYHEKLGSLYDKAQRMERIARSIASLVRAEPEQSSRAAILAKADLSTGMVGEFPELQGIMGRYYALHDREHPAVAEAVAAHYKPAGPNDTCPTAPVSVVVALADKIDALAAFFAIGETPTGSRDPFALRRAALGIIRLVLENRLRGFRLTGVFQRAALNLDPRRGGIRDPSAELVEFIADRLKVHLREQGVRHDLIAAAFAQAGGREDDLVRLMARVDALRDFLDTEDGANLLVAYRRAANIVAIEERRDGRSYAGEIDRARLQQEEERALAAAFDETGRLAGAHLAREDFAAAMAGLAGLRRPVDAFFDKVTVNCEDAALRANRLRMLSHIRATMNQVADFSQIEG